MVYCGVTPDKKPEGGLEGIFGELAITVDIIILGFLDYM